MHIDLAQPDRAFEVDHDLSQGFSAAARRFNPSVLEPRMQVRLDALQLLAEPSRDAFLPLWRRVAQPCWEGRRACVQVEDLIAERRSEPNIPPDLLARFDALFA